MNGAAAGRAGELALPCNPKWATCGGQITRGAPARRRPWLRAPGDEGAPTQGLVGGCPTRRGGQQPPSTPNRVRPGREQR